MTIEKLIEALASDLATAEADRTSGVLHRIPPTTVEILETGPEPTPGHTTVWFVLDFVILHYAQSGSDWYYHHVFGGRATIVDHKVVDSTLVRLREQNVSEFAMESAPVAERYDQDRERRLDRDAWWSTVLAARS